MKKPFIVLLLTFVIVFQALAQQPAASFPSVERLRADVTYLASDALQGRRTGSKGVEMAAAYLKKEFQRLRLQPAGARYEQQFPYVAGVALGAGNTLSFTPAGGKSLSFKAGADWQPLGFAPNGNLSAAPAVFVGYGISAAELSHNDYANLDVKGKVAVALTGAPNNDAKFGRQAEARFKANAAKNNGAVALILLSQEDNFSNERLAQLRYNNDGEAGLPLLVLSKTASARVLANGCAALRDLPNGVKIAPCGDAQVSQQPDGRIVLTSGANIGISPEMWQKQAVTLSVKLTRRSAPGHNVIGILPGNDPMLKSEAIVIGAHYDHLGAGGAGSLAAKEGEIHHGADDNASGTVGLLELARLFTAEKRNRRTLIFAAFSGEEEGLLGSNFYVNSPVWPLDKTIAMINMDMIGRMKDNKMTVGGIGTAREFRPLIEQLNSNTPVAVANAKRFDLALSEDGFGPSDHSSFYAKQIPVLFFFTGAHEDYHKPSDTADKINYEAHARILQLISEVIHNIDANDKRPTYTVAPTSGGAGRRSQSFNVSLGVIPGYAESSDGMKLDGVRAGSPAEKAGLKAGDKVVKLAGFEVKNVQDYTYALGQMKAGVEYEVEIVRGNERLTLKITPVARA